MINELLEGFNRKNLRKNRLAVNLAGTALTLFIIIGLLFPFKDRILALLYPKPVSKAYTADRFLTYTCTNLGALLQTGFSSQPLNDIDSNHPLSGFWQPNGPASIDTLTYRIWKSQLYEIVLSGGTLFTRPSANADFTGLIGQNWQVDDVYDVLSRGTSGAPGRNEKIKAFVARKYNGKYQELVYTDNGGDPESDKVYYRSELTAGLWDMDPNWGSALLKDIWASIGLPNSPPAKIDTTYITYDSQGHIQEGYVMGSTVWYHTGSTDDANSVPFVPWNIASLSDAYSSLLGNPPTSNIKSLTFVPFKGVMREIVTSQNQVWHRTCLDGRDAQIQNLLNQIYLFDRYYEEPNNGIATILHADYSDMTKPQNNEAEVASHFRTVMGNAVALTGQYLVEGDPQDKVDILWLLNNSIDRHAPDSEGHKGWVPTWLSYLAVYDLDLVGWIFWNDLDSAHRQKLERINIDEAQAITDHIDQAKVAYRNLMNDNNNDFVRVTSIVNALQKNGPSFITDDGFPDQGQSYQEALNVFNNLRYEKYFEVSSYINDTKAEDLSGMTGF